MAVYHSFEDVVTEGYDPAQDGDDGDPVESRISRLAQAAQPFHRLRALRPSPTTFAGLVVPYVQVGEGDRADAVYGIKRAYARSKGGSRLRQLMSKPLEVRRSWGPTFSAEFGQRNYTKARHEQLAPYFDSFAIALMHPTVSPRDKQIALQIGWHTALYNRRMSVFYSQIRPSQLGPANLITRADCSGSVAGGCAWAQILPKVDWRYTNTWAQITFGSPVPDLAHAKVGDVFLYGSPSHEALYVGNGLVWSFGSYPIKILPHDYRHDRAAIRRFVPLRSPNE